MRKEMITLFGQSFDKTALVKGYGLAEKCLEKAISDFYDELFINKPDIKLLFKNSDFSSQSAKLSGALKLLIENIHDEKTLITVLSDLGERHQLYGVLPDQYPIVVEILNTSFKKNVGRSWTKAISLEWTKLLIAAAQIMCSAYRENVMKNETKPSKKSRPVLLLNSIQDISKSQELKDQMLTLFDTTSNVDIDGSEVERIDGSAMQLLCALFIYAQKNNYTINWISPTEAFKKSVTTLGMQKILLLDN